MSSQSDADGAPEAETQAKAEAKPEATPAAKADAKPEAKTEEESGGLLPAIIVGAGILLVASLLIFGGGDDDADKATAKKDAASAAQGADGAGPAGGGGKGGVQARPYDAAARRAADSKVNPKIKLPNLGMAPETPPKPEEIPNFQSTAEEIAWYEKKLAGAKKIRDDRQKYVDRLPKVKEKILEGPNPDEGLKSFEGRSKIVEENLTKAEQKIAELEAKLAKLRGG